jgi:hypothetical protein
MEGSESWEEEVVRRKFKLEERVVGRVGICKGLTASGK